MKLTDLNHTHDINAFLIANDWFKIGHGRFSNVYDKTNSKFVIKATHRDDPSYDLYIQLVKKSHNPHFPIIVDRQILNNNTHVYLIEKLFPISKNDHIKAVAIQRIVSNCTNNKSLPDIFKVSEKVKRFPHLVANANNLYNIAKTFPPKLIEAARLIGNLHGVTFDIHDNNIMQRKDGTIVITDPCDSPIKD